MVRIGVVLAVLTSVAGSFADYRSNVIPEVPREFRALWIATVDNIDWPSEPGLSSAAQQEELRSMFDMAVELGCNAIVFQVRPIGDALYASELEPWSSYLSGTQGVAPEPLYDPLAMAVEEAHRRGMELHAWLNPYRAGHPSNDTVADTHVRQTKPWVHKYGPYHWMDPGHPEALAHTMAVVCDIVERYDIDGIHFDDYFYPYPVNKAEGDGKVPFPDADSYQMYRYGGGELEVADWRRDNINRMVAAVYTETKARKPHVKVGFSPFGIWRPGHPKQIKGFDAYAGLYADARLWLHEGWLDYIVPQLYWAIDPPAQSYPVLLKWWVKENRKQRHIWIGNGAHRALSNSRGWTEQELARQVQITREETGASGNVFFSAKWFRKPEVADPIRALYAEPALVPASPWLDEARPPAPICFVTETAEGPQLQIVNQADEAITHWAIQTRSADGWSLQIVTGPTEQLAIDAACEIVVVRSVDRVGNLSPTTCVMRAPRR